MLGFSFGGTNEGRERARVKDSQKGQPTRYRLASFGEG